MPLKVLTQEKLHKPAVPTVDTNIPKLIKHSQIERFSMLNKRIHKGSSTKMEHKQTEQCNKQNVC